MTIEAMKLALEALDSDNPDIQLRAATALRAAIDQAEKQKPVAWMVYTLDGQSVCVTDNPADFTDKHRALPLYTAPGPNEDYERGFVDGMQEQMKTSVDRAVNATCKREWVEITLEEIPYDELSSPDFLVGARWAEAKLKEKNA